MKIIIIVIIVIIFLCIIITIYLTNKKTKKTTKICVNPYLDKNNSCKTCINKQRDINTKCINCLDTGAQKINNDNCNLCKDKNYDSSTNCKWGISDYDSSAATTLLNELLYKYKWLPNKTNAQAWDCMLVNFSNDYPNPKDFMNFSKDPNFNNYALDLYNRCSKVSL